MSSAEKITSIQQVVHNILLAIPGAPMEETVDTFKAGDPAQEVTGIVTTFLASCQVIQRAIDLGANLIITHEPTYYNHLDEVGWLKGDPVYEAKRRLIEENKIVIWRFHDHWHMHRPDGILTGLVKELGWEDYADAENLAIYNVPPVSLRDLAVSLKERLGMRTVRAVGNLDMICHRAGLVPGALAGEAQIAFLGRENIDVLICGELHEWEVPEYVRDAVAQGKKKAVIVLGHANSEEAGMKWLVEWLRSRLPGVPITHVPVGDPFYSL